ADDLKDPAIGRLPPSRSAPDGAGGAPRKRRSGRFWKKVVAWLSGSVAGRLLCGYATGQLARKAPLSRRGESRRRYTTRGDAAPAPRRSHLRPAFAREV